MRRVHFTKRNKIGLSMTSMIDVIFLLLIFFVCTANFRPLEERLPMNLSLPGSITEFVTKNPEYQDLKFAIVHISFTNDEPHWQIEGRSCGSLAEVKQILAQLAEIKLDFPIIIDSEKETPFQYLIEVYDTCRQVGLNRVQISAKDASQPF